MTSAMRSKTCILIFILFDFNRISIN